MSKWKKSLKNLFTVTSVLMMTACANSTAPSPDKLPAALVQGCPDLPLLQSGGSGEVLRWGVQAAYLYKDCQARHRALVEAVETK